MKLYCPYCKKPLKISKDKKMAYCKPCKSGISEIGFNLEYYKTINYEGLRKEKENE